MMMSPLERPDSFHLEAAVGWLELGNPAEAEAEWARIDAEHRQRFEVLEVEWAIRAAQRDWPRALEAARGMIRTAPLEAQGWISQSYSLHEMKRTEEALNELLKVAETLSHASTIPYNLACYASQLGRIDEARAWIRRAIRIKGKSTIRKMALADPDLHPILDFIESL